MDLNYPSERIKNLSGQLNNIDRRFGSVIISNPRIQLPSKIIPGKLKKKCLDLISKDKADVLITVMNQQAISLCDQISKQGHGWTILHFIAKSNSAKSMSLCLKWLYQTQPNNYQAIANQKNIEGDTPLLIACTQKSNKVVKSMLQLGGVDIYVMNSKKLTAYQIALTSFNQQCLQMLMKYELKIKRRNSINKNALNEPLPQPKSRTFQSFFSCLIDCFNFSQSQAEATLNNKDTQTDRRMMKKDQKMVNFLEPIPNIQIFWSDVDKIYKRKLPLFSAVSHPFSIKQSSIIVSNLMIIFQVLAEHTELLKRIIFTTDDKYYVKFNTSTYQTVIAVDNMFPFFLETNQPVFLSMGDQLWPMVLQKGLSLYYKGFFQPAKIPVQQLLQTIIDNQIFTLNLASHENNDICQQIIKSMMEKMQFKNSILILKPKAECPFKAQQGRIECFSLLKISGDNFLINCPFVMDQDKVRQQKQTRQMKLHRAHYHNPNCTTIWLSTIQFFNYFETAIFCNVLNAAISRKNTMKVVLNTNRIYILLKVKQKLQTNTLYLSFKDQKQNKMCKVSKCMGWSMKGSQRQAVEKINCQILGQIQITNTSFPAQILVVCQFQENFQGDKKEIIGICRSEQIVQIEAIDCVIGDLQFIECCKKYYNQQYEIFDSSIVQSVGDYLLIMAASQQACYVSFPSNLSEENIIQGTLIKEQSKLQMFKFQHIHFAVLSNIDYQTAKNLQILSYDQVQPIESPEMVTGTATN